MGSACTCGKNKKNIQNPSNQPPPQVDPHSHSPVQQKSPEKKPPMAIELPPIVHQEPDNSDIVPLESTAREFPEDPLQHYGLKRLILEEASKGYTFALEYRSIVEEDKLIRGLADIVRSDVSLIKAFKDFVLRSSKDSAFAENAQLIAANAITVLVAANIGFFEEDLSGIRIKGANLRNGVFSGCDLRKANLTGVRLQNCKFFSNDLTNAVMKDVDLGAYPSIDCGMDVTGLKLAPEAFPHLYLMSVHKNDQRVILWDYLTNERVEEHEGHAGNFAQNGFWYAVSKHKSIQIWKEVSKRSFKMLRTLEDHSDLVNLLEFISEGSELLSASVDRSIKLWDVAQGLLKRTFSGHTDYITAVSYCASLSLIVSSSYDKSVVIWNKDTGKQLKKIQEHHDLVNSVAFFEEGSKFLSISDETPSKIHVWRSQDGYQQKSFEGLHYHSIKSLALSKQGTLLLTVSKDKIQVFDHRKSQVLFEYMLQGIDQTFAAIFSPDERRIISGGTDKRISFIDCSNGKSCKIFEGHPTSSLITALDISPDGTMIVSGGNDNLIRLWATSTGKLIRVYTGHSGEVSAVGFLNKGDRFLSAGKDKSAILWKSNRSERVEEFKTDYMVSALSVSPKNEEQFVCAAGKTIKFFSISPKKQLGVGEGHTDLVTCVRYSPNGYHVASGSLDKTVILWDLNAKAIRTLIGHSGPVYSLSFSNKYGNNICSSGTDSTIKVWNQDSGEKLFEFNAHYYDINCVCYSPDGSYIFSASNDNNIKIFDEEGGNCLRTLDAHSSHVTHVCCSKDGTVLASAGKDSAIRVWHKSNRAGVDYEYFLGEEINKEESGMKWEGTVISGVKELSEFNRSILIENGAKVGGHVKE